MILGDICLTGIAQFQSGKLQKKRKEKETRLLWLSGLEFYRCLSLFDFFNLGCRIFLPQKKRKKNRSRDFF